MKKQKSPSSHTWDERPYFRDTTQIDAPFKAPSQKVFTQPTGGSNNQALALGVLPPAPKCYSLTAPVTVSQLHGSLKTGCTAVLPFSQPFKFGLIIPLKHCRVNSFDGILIQKMLPILLLLDL